MIPLPAKSVAKLATRLRPIRRHTIPCPQPDCLEQTSGKCRYFAQRHLSVHTFLRHPVRCSQMQQSLFRGIPAALHQQQYPYPQISYQYGAIPTNFMVCYLGFVCRQPHSQAPWAHRGTAQYLPPQHPNSFPHAHMRDSRVIGLEIVEL